MPERGGASGWRWLATLAGLSLLAIPGFGLGLFAGLVWEEPGLVASYLLGETREVVLRGGESPPVAADPRVQPRPDVAAPPPVPLSQPRAESASGRFAVQVGAFGDAPAAERLARELRGKRFPVYVSAGASDARARWRVRVGPLPSREEAERTAARLKAQEKLPTWVLEEAG